MNWTNSIVVLAFMTTVIGSLVSIIWLLFYKCLIDVCPRVIYTILKISLLFYILPIFLLAISFDSNNPYIVKYGNIDLVYFGTTPVIRVLAIIIIVAWSISASSFIVLNISQAINLSIIKRNCYPVTDDYILSELKRLAAQIGIKRKIRIFYNDKIQSPMIYSIFVPTIVLPKWNYDDRRIKLILLHELMHYRHKDIHVKLFSGFLTILHSYNIFAYRNNIHINIWSEFRCDLRVCEHEDGTCFGSKEYYGIIVEYLEKMISKKDSQNTGMSLVDSENSVMRRIDIMVKNKNAKVFSKTGMAAIVMAFVMLSSSVSFAAGCEVTNLYEKLYTSTVVIVQDESIADEEDIEYEIAPEDDDCVEVVIMEEAVIGLRSTLVTFNWSVNSGVRAQSTSYMKSAGETIMISCTSLPGDSLYWIGIIEPDGTVRYTSGTGAKGHTFSLTKTGYYSAFVQNKSSVTITAVGSYTK